MHKNKLTALICTALLGTGLVLSLPAQAAPPPGAPPALQQGGGPSLPPPPGFGRPRPTKEQLIEMASQRTGCPKEKLEALVEAGTSPRDLGMVANYAKISGRSLEEIAAMRRTMTVGRIDYALGLTPEIKEQNRLKAQAAELLEANVVSLADAARLLAQGYSVGEIKMAQALSLRCQTGLEAILAKKTAAKSWTELGKELGIEEAAVKELAGRLRVGPARKGGPGFSNIHFKKIDRSLITRVLHDNFLFSEEEIGACYDQGMSFGEIDLACLYAYLAKRPLGEVLKLRESCTEEQIKQRLGFTPQSYHDSVIAYQARRLQDRFGIDAKVTIDYMSRGYAMHHVVSAYLIAPMCGLELDQVINRKVPGQRWLELAPELGLSQEQFTSVTDKISWEFRTKYE